MKQLSLAECDHILTAPGSDLETVEEVISGRRMKVWKNLPPTFRAFLLELLQKWGERTFLSSPLPIPGAPAAYRWDVDPREHVTYNEVLERSIRLAAWMRARGLGVGSKIVIDGGNSTGWVMSFIAIHLIGGIAICMNAWLPRGQMIYCFKMTRPDLLLLDEERAELLSPYRHIRETGLPDMFCWDTSSFVESVEAVLRTPNEAGKQDVLSSKGLEQLGPESDATIFFSSGTSGFPKAVLSTQRAALSNVNTAKMAPARAALRAGLSLPKSLSPDDPQKVSFLAIPLFHVTGCLSWLLRAFVTGSKLVMMRRWNVNQAVKLCVEEKVNLIGGVPTVASSILNSPDLPKDIQFDGVLYGGAPSSKTLESEIRARWPKAAVLQGYGLSETNAVMCNVVGSDYAARPESAGIPAPTYDVKVVDPESRKELPIGQAGILCIRGVQVMKCYYGDPKATKAAIDEEGWFDTGDVACLDEEGFVYIKDRFKDLIIRGGENIASADVENAIYSHSAIDECAAIPLPHPILGEVVGAIVSLRPAVAGEVAEEELIEHARKTLPRYAVPVMVVISREALPKNVNGKILKKELKEEVVKEWEKRGGAKAYDARRAKL
ncbi:hypothetical protein IAT38_001543 [Cryptococcus sp. DSM 104549]